MEVVNAMLKSSPNYKTALVIGAEKLSSITDWEDRNTCVLFGDGAAALVMKKEDDQEDTLIGSKHGCDGNYTEILHLPAGGSEMPASYETIDNRMHYLKMNGQDVFKLAVNAMVGACKETLTNAGVDPSEIVWLVPHQANYRILKAVATRVGIPEERVFMNVQKYGNTSAASIGICLDEMCRGNEVKKGDYVLLTAFGGGLTWGAILLRWNL
jgi:3-oxoacyl-[acyl-carrier-protein] synthase-3